MSLLGSQVYANATTPLWTPAGSGGGPTGPTGTSGPTGPTGPAGGGGTVANSASSLSIPFFTLNDLTVVPPTTYPQIIAVNSIQNKVPLGNKFLLTATINFGLSPITPTFGSERIALEFAEQTGVTLTPVNLFSPVNTIDILLPDRTISNTPFSITNSTELVSDGGSNWSVSVTAAFSFSGLPGDYQSGSPSPGLTLSIVDLGV